MELDWNDYYYNPGYFASQLIHKYVYIYIYIYICVCVCVCVCVWMGWLVCVYVCLYELNS